MLDEEIKGQRVLGTVLPVIFFAVAAFLLNVVVSRLVGTQREQIAALKALGYGNAAIAAHYQAHPPHPELLKEFRAFVLAPR
jgi:putative ABC transport system permease protein